MKSKKNLVKLVSAFAIFTLIVFTACEKTDDTNINLNDDAESTVLSQTIATEIFDEISEIMDEAIQNSEDVATEADLKDGSTTQNMMGRGYHHGHYRDTINLIGKRLYRLSECVTITRDFSEDMDTLIMVVDFGDENCLGPDGRERRGKIIITRIGQFYWDSDGISVTTTFEDYYVDNNQITGTKVVNAYLNESQQRVHEITDNGQIILADDAGTITWQAQRTRTVVEGSMTRIKFDDVIHITGSSSGSDAEGNTFTSEIVEPLVRIYEEDCHRHPVSGIVEIFKSPDTYITINYGDGTCDNLIEVTTNGETEIIELQGEYRRNNNK